MFKKFEFRRAAIGGLFCLFACVPSLVFAKSRLDEKSFPKDIQAAFVKEGIAVADVSAYAVPMEPYVLRRPQAYVMGGNQLANPASVTKIFTTGLALDKLGSTYRFKTGFYAQSQPVDGVLNGPLYIKGSGDPSFQTTNLWSALRQLRSDGLKTIKGPVVLDRTAFRAVGVDTEAVGDDDDFDDAPYRAYHAEPDALLLNYGAMALRIEVDGNSSRVVPMEAPRNWAFVSELHLTNGGCGAWKNGLSVDYKKVGADVVLTLRGDYPKRCGQNMLPIRISHQDWLWDSWFNEIWQQLGGEFSGQVISGQVPVGAVSLYAMYGDNVGDLIKTMNKYSNNVMARHFELAVSSTSPNSFNDMMQSWLGQHGIATQGWLFENGSGLARNTRIDAQGLTDYLVYMSTRSDYSDFLSSLPRAGVDGTLSKRLKSVNGYAYMKTGSLSGVKTLAGYVKDVDGQWWAVGLMVKSPRAYQAWAPMEKLIEYVYKTK